MPISHRLRAAERTADQHRASVAGPGVCDRIDELTALYAEHPPTFDPTVEAGIIAAVERQIRADEQFCGSVAEDRL